jgi:hypothetical protein
MRFAMKDELVAEELGSVPADHLFSEFAFHSDIGCARTWAGRIQDTVAKMGGSTELGAHIGNITARVEVQQAV